MPLAFVIRPFGVKKDQKGNNVDFDRVYEKMIRPALEEVEFSGGSMSEIKETGNIREDMFRLIHAADLVICDLSIHNANVFYELGIRHALRRNRTILLRDESLSDDIPFDLQTDRYFTYDAQKPGNYRKQLLEVIQATLKSDRQWDSPVFHMLPRLQEPAFEEEAPSEFRYEVERARAAKLKGWLRLLSEEVLGRDFSWAGLRLVAKAQFNLKDFKGARKSWEEVRKYYPHDIESNLYLASIYERLFRRGPRKLLFKLCKKTSAKDTPVEFSEIDRRGKWELFELSQQAIENVLKNPAATMRNRTEALTLRGRNYKTRWRLEFEHLDSLEMRRRKAANRELKETYEAYRNAYFQDLNHFYSGVSALQMGVIFQDLQEEESWKAIFDNDDEAQIYSIHLRREVDTLWVMALAAIESCLNNPAASMDEKYDARISKANYLFLADTNKERVANAFKNAISAESPYAWASTKSQLLLFSRLGVRTELAEEVIPAVEERFQLRRNPSHIIIFVGPRMEKKEEGLPLISPESEGKILQKLEKALKELAGENKPATVLGMSAAAPEGEILFLEACSQLGISTEICLPMPRNAYASQAFEHSDISWRNRFLAISSNGQQHKILELNDREELPNWLWDSGACHWERGRRWIIQRALARGAEKVSLLALMGEGKDGPYPASIAQLVDFARANDKVVVNVLNVKELLK